MNILLLLASLLGVSLVTILGVSLGASLGTRVGTSLRRTPCQSPPLLTGEFSLYMSRLNVTMVGSYVYDAVEQRIRLRLDVRLLNHSFPVDLLLLYKEGVGYHIDTQASTCAKSPLQGDFQPPRVPLDAAFGRQYVIGDSSEPVQGLRVNTWVGMAPDPYTMTMTESGCIPVSFEMHTKLLGCVTGSFYNNVRNVADPDALKPPPYCPGLGAKTQGPPVDFLTLLNRAAK